MTPRERWLAILTGETPDRLPTDYWATPEFDAKLRASLGCPDLESLSRRLGIDSLKHVGAKWNHAHHPDDPHADVWGVRHQQIDYGSGAYSEVSRHPLADVSCVDDVHAFRWPDPDDLDYGSVEAALKQDDGFRLIRGGHYEPFLLYCSMRGMEQAYEDLLLNPDIAEAVLNHLFEFHYEANRRIWEAGNGRIDLMYLAEDLGGQHGPLFSMETYRRFLLPGQKKMAHLAKSFGVRVLYHTDGAASVFLPALVHEVGIDVLNPIQWRCPGMERDKIAMEFGGAVALHGGIDNQHTLPFGSVEDVRREVRETAEIFKECRWICAPCHNIQSITPVENVVAMYEEAGEMSVVGL